jgi:AcrR family transcriptional regulator
LGVTTFQRARSDEQREMRRRSILDAAAAMLTEMPVAEVTLNGLSRRAGLAKSNVLRYFESREAVLLELLDAAWQDWLAELGPSLGRPAGTGRSARGPGGRAARADSARERGDELAAVLADSLTSRPVLCDLLSAQSAVLERNVSPAVAAAFKRAALANVSALAQLALRRVPELGDHDAYLFAGAAILSAGALWTTTQPSKAMVAAYDSDPALGALQLKFTSTLRELLAVLISGLLARSSTAAGQYSTG